MKRTTFSFAVGLLMLVLMGAMVPWEKPQKSWDNKKSHISARVITHDSLNFAPDELQIQKYIIVTDVEVDGGKKISLLPVSLEEGAESDAMKRHRNGIPIEELAKAISYIREGIKKQVSERLEFEVDQGNHIVKMRIASDNGEIKFTGRQESLWRIIEKLEEITSRG